MQVTPPKSQSR